MIRPTVGLALTVAVIAAGPGRTQAPAPLGPAGAPASAFPAPDRPVADIVSPTWGDAGDRDRAGEAAQIAGRLQLRPGMTVADIGAGDGYDTLRLAKLVGPQGRVIAEDVMASYLATLSARARAQHLSNITLDLGEPSDARLPPRSVDAAIFVHMYHEIAQPYALLYNLAASLKPGARVGVEELNRPTAAHGTPPALLVCEFQAVGYREVSMAPLSGGLGYFTVFSPPSSGARPDPSRIKPCRG